MSGSSHRPLPRLTRRVVRLLSVVLVGGPLLAVGIGDASADTVPYTDYASYGSIGFCDRSGHAVTHGNINDKPFVWLAVSSAAPPAPYAVPGGKASLVAYQPRPNTYPTQWSGDVMTAASTYSNPAHPMAAATSVDFSLKDFMNEFPPQVDGLIQLRMFVGIPNHETLSTAYPTTDVKVTGDTWSVVRGASVSCSVGTAKTSESAATIKSHTSPSATPRPSATASSHSSAASASPGGVSGTPAATSTDGTASLAEAGAAPVATQATSNPVKVITLGILFAAIVLSSVLGILRWRRRT